ncbi:hypothetical protein [Roseococcus pinisoli]|uniref:Uncharacterized protein n=1 Tax=Roseococcus pinisoli TaxID=2835040 RepID=A0ABS5QC27_9PROT|nr:hypothetical protein [Roseococcus pinisoli]MBS7810502.1 hypothetical protein [Roseococcus pinisoli]
MADERQMGGVLRRLETRVAGWISRRAEDRLMERFGGIQRCPWCRQFAQTQPGWSFRPWDDDASLDVLTCGVCRGTSVWLFGMGMHAMGPLDPPRPDPEFPNYVERTRALAAQAEGGA